MEPLELFGRGDQPKGAIVLEGIAAGPDLIGHTAEGGGQSGGVGLERTDPLFHQRHEVVPHPRDGGELAPVRDLVQGEPQSELPGFEAMLTL